MKKNIVRNCAIICALALAATGCGHKMTRVQQSTAMEKALHTAVMLDRTMGYAVGMQGRVRYTEDGGATWQNGENKSPCLFSVCALNGLECVAAGNNSTLVQTVDGGRTWKNLNRVPAGRARGISFCEISKGWVWSRVGLFETLDNSETWTRVTFPEGEKIVETAYMISSNTGFIVTGSGFVYRLTNGNWEQITRLFNKEDTTFDMIHAGDYQQVAITFSKENTAKGYIAVSGNVNGKAVIRMFGTEDGGTTWNELFTQKIIDKPMTMCFNTNCELSTLNINETLSVYTIQ